MSRGFFLTFEGLDGAGKTTQIQLLAELLRERSEPLTLTRQPGGTLFGDRIRALLLESANTSASAEPVEISPRAELGLMFSDRAETIAQVIEPALARGETVLCDRFTDSTEAYQGGGRALGTEIVHALHAALCGDLQPDLTVLLLPDRHASLARARRRNEHVAKQGPEEGRFERENDAFYCRVFEQYQAIAAREPVRVVVIDGEQSIEQTHERIVRVVTERLAAHRR